MGRGEGLKKFRRKTYFHFFYGRPPLLDDEVDVFDLALVTARLCHPSETEFLGVNELGNILKDPVFELRLELAYS